MDLKQLKYFVKIVEEGSITAAAKKLYMSQPPLSNQLKSLEEELDCTLVERGARNIHLTEAGETLYNYAISLLDLSKVAKEETIIAAKKHDEKIRIGIVSSIICSTALDWIHAFSLKYPDLSFEIVEGNTYELISRFHTNSIHLGLLRTPFNDNGLTYKKIFTDSLVLIGKKDFFKDENSYISLEELSAFPLIIYRRWEQIIKDLFVEKRLDMNCYCINDDARTTFYFVEAGMGVGFVPYSAVALIKNPEIVCKKICNCNINSDVVIAYDSSNTLPKCSKAFIEYILTNTKQD